MMRFAAGVIVGIWIDQNYRVPNVEQKWNEIKDKILEEKPKK